MQLYNTFPSLESHVCWSCHVGLLCMVPAAVLASQGSQDQRFLGCSYATEAPRLHESTFCSSFALVLSVGRCIHLKELSGICTAWASCEAWGLAALLMCK